MNVRKRKDETKPMHILVKLDPSKDRKLIKAVNGIMDITRTKSRSGAVTTLLDRYAAPHLANLKMERTMAK